MIKLNIQAHIRDVSINGEISSISMIEAKFQSSAYDDFYRNKNFLEAIEARAALELQKLEPYHTLNKLQVAPTFADCEVYYWPATSDGLDLRDLIQIQNPPSSKAPPPLLRRVQRIETADIKVTFRLNAANRAKKQQHWTPVKFYTNKKATNYAIQRLKQIVVFEPGSSINETSEKLHDLLHLFKMESRYCFMSHWPTKHLIPFSEQYRSAYYDQLPCVLGTTQKEGEKEETAEAFQAEAPRPFPPHRPPSPREPPPRTPPPTTRERHEPRTSQENNQRQNFRGQRGGRRPYRRPTTRGRNTGYRDYLLRELRHLDQRSSPPPRPSSRSRSGNRHDEHDDKY